MTAVLIYAAGKQTRWDLPTKKQLVDVGGEPLLCRTIRQVRVKGYEPIVIAHDPEIIAVARISFNPPKKPWFLESFLETAHLWKKQTIVLFGDVVFSPAAIDIIFAARGLFRVFMRKELLGRLVGNLYETFAFRFEHTVSQRLCELSRVVLATTEDFPEDVLSGDVRRLYEEYCGLPSRKYEFESEVFCPIEDWTDDFDTTEDYEHFCQIAIGRGWL